MGGITLTSRERIINTLRFKRVDRIPRDYWVSPAVWMERTQEFEKFNNLFEFDIVGPKFSYAITGREKGNELSDFKYTDAWGVNWERRESGVTGEVKEPILRDSEDLKNYKVPFELIKESDFSNVNDFCKKTEKFVLANTQVRPFERIQFLHGTENVYIDIAMEDEDFFDLLNRIHEYGKLEMEKWANTDVDGVMFMDDWGSQNSLLISPEKWRAYFKPLYKEYCDILRSRGKYVFMHSDGNIESIYPDLIEIGVNCINSQLFCMNIEKLGELYSGEIVFWGEIDRQYVLPFGNQIEVAAAVNRVANALFSEKKTGVIAHCEWGKDVPLSNMITVFDTWNKVGV